MAQLIITTAGTTVWQAPAGVTEVFVELIGGGGGGGAATGNPATGGGGAGGNYAAKTVTVTPLNNYNVVVGAATSASSGNGATGSTSSFNSTDVIALGGLGGTAGVANSTNGAGATATSVGCVGTTIFTGGDGGTGVFTSGSGFSGSGGGGAGSAGDGGDSNSEAAGGTGQGDGGGNGANGVGNNSAGGTGSQAGGGGSGGKANNNTNRNGGIGAAGWARLTWQPIVEMSEAPPISDPLAFALEFTGPSESVSLSDLVSAIVQGTTIDLSVAEACAATDTVNLTSFDLAVSEAPPAVDANGFTVFFEAPAEGVAAVDSITVLVNNQDIGFEMAEANPNIDTALFGLDVAFPDETVEALDTIAYEVRGNTSLAVVEDTPVADTVGLTLGTILGASDGVNGNVEVGLLVELNQSVSEAPSAVDTVTLGVVGALPAIAVSATVTDTLEFRYRTFLQPAPHEIMPVSDTVSLGRQTDILITESVAAADTDVVVIFRQETAEEEAIDTTDAVTLDVTTTTAPDAPLNLVATFVDADEIHLAWDAALGTPATSYELQWSPGGAGTWNTLTNALVLSFQHTGLAASTTYDYRVRASNTAGASAFTELLGTATDAGTGATTAGRGFIKRGFQLRGSGRVLTQRVGVQRATIVEPGQTDQAYPTDGGI